MAMAPPPLLVAVPNVSEGRDRAVLERLEASVGPARVLDLLVEAHDERLPAIERDALPLDPRDYLNGVMARHPDVSAALVTLFHAENDPHFAGDRKRATSEAREARTAHSSSHRRMEDSRSTDSHTDRRPRERASRSLDFGELRHGAHCTRGPSHAQARD